MGCFSWKARIMRLLRKNSGIDERAATAYPCTQEFPPTSSPSKTPTLPEEQKRNGGGVKQKAYNI